MRAATAFFHMQPASEPNLRNAGYQSAVPLASRVLVFLSFVLVTLRPWPSEEAFGAAAVQVAEALVLVTLATIFALLLTTARARMPTSSAFWFVPVLLLLSIGSSLFVNMSNLTGSDVIELARPVYALSLLGIGYYGSRALGVSRFQRIFLSMVMVVGALQIPIAPLQLLAPDFMEYFHKVYSDRKVLAGSIRATGTFGNPNHLAIFLVIAQAATFCTMRGVKRWLLWGLYYIGIIFTGSLSILLLSLVLILPLKIVTERSQKVEKLAFYVLIGMVVLAVIVPVFAWLIPLEESYRLGRLQSAVRGGLDGILSIRNLELRVQAWSRFVASADLNNPMTLMFGLGPMKGRGLDAVDNEALFIFLRHGLVGISAALVVLVGLLWVFLRSPWTVSAVGLVVVILYLLCTPFFEMFSVWRLMPYYLIPLGVAIHEPHVLGRLNVGSCRYSRCGAE